MTTATASPSPIASQPVQEEEEILDNTTTDEIETNDPSVKSDVVDVVDPAAETKIEETETQLTHDSIDIDLKAEIVEKSELDTKTEESLPAKNIEENAVKIEPPEIPAVSNEVEEEDVEAEENLTVEEANDMMGDEIIALMPSLRKEESVHNLISKSNDQNVAENLPLSSIRCIGRQEDEILDNESMTCGEVNYLVEVNELKKAYAPKADKQSVVRKPPSISDLTSDEMKLKYTYTQLFEDFISQRKAYKFQMNDYRSNAENQKDDLFTKCSEDGKLKQNPITLDFPLRECPNYQKNLSSVMEFHLPNIATNSYVYRFISDDGINYVDRNNIPFDYKSHWPSIVTVDDSPLSLHQCPANMNMVLWSLDDSKNVDIRLFHKTEASKFQFIDEDTKLASPFIHHVRFQKNSFDHSNDPVLSQLRYTETSISNKEYIFIPNNVLVSMKKSTSMKEAAVLFRTCVVDASNLNSFRKALFIGSLISPYERKIFDKVSSRAFNTTMERTPKQVDFREIVDRSKLSTASASVENRENKIDDTAAHNKKSNSNRRDRRDRGNKRNFKSWQDVNKWNSMITGMTIPRPYRPSIISVGRQNITLEWVSSFLPKIEDKTKFGYNFTICHEEDCSNLVIERGDESIEGFEEKKMKRGLVDGDNSLSIFQCIYKDLKYDANYRVQLKMFYNTFESEVSDWVPFKTEPLRAPYQIPLTGIISAENIAQTSLTLKFPTPLDDGGRPILAYNVFVKHADEDKNFDHQWILWGKHEFKLHKNGKDTTINVGNLLPNSEYQFQLAAFNEIGNASLSSQASKVLMPKFTPTGMKAEKIYGRGMTHDSLATYSFFTGVKPEIYVTLDDKKQTVKCNQEVISADVWTTHWSPKSFIVESEVVWVEPFLLEGEVQNADSIRGNIALVSRGVIPLVYKIHRLQEAGAVGVIILDSGVCKKYDQVCAPGATKSDGEGWGLHDIERPWKTVRIPSVLITRGNEDTKLGRCLGFQPFKDSDREEL